MHNPHSCHVQQVMALAQGKVQASGPAADPSIARSWLRCLEDYRLDPERPMALNVLEHAHVLERRERLSLVLEIAGSEMSNLYQQLCGGDHAVLLTDARGVVLNWVTADLERATFERAGVRLGADWSEACEGTNGVGTCVVERQPLTIHQEEHFRSRHTGLTCSASPVFDPQGELMAVLDVSSVRFEVSRQSQFHTMALVNLSAKVIESCYFLRSFEGEWLLRFHPQAECIGLFNEGLLAFGGDGSIRAANQSALNLLGLPRERLLNQPLEAFFDIRLDALLGLATAEARTSWTLRTRGGRILFAALRCQPVRRTPAEPTAQPRSTSGICLADAALQNDFRRALRVYEHDVPVLINGETGCGKEAFARALHRASSRAEQPFIALNCAAIPETLIESELFGYRDGSFTGARKGGMRGKLQQANGGTLFLDEIGDMPLALQTRLLRVLDERLVVPIGGEPETVDVRIISATHRKLEQLIQAGDFREDLYYRLNGLVLELPPLRERHDKAELLEHLLTEEARGQPVQLADDARQLLLNFPWPGNVRQLRNVLRTLNALCEGGVIRLADLPSEIRCVAASTRSAASARALDDAECTALIQALKAQRWNMTRTALQLGISRNTLYRKLRKHGIEVRG